jgi:phosphatidylinositol alpha-1,6-mannosyltransferase
VLVHGSDVLREGWVYQRVIRFLLKRAMRVAANSAQTRGLLERLGVDGGKIDVIHPGVRVQVLDGAGASMYEGRRVLLSVGRLIRRKGLLEFVEHVMPRLVREHAGVLLLIVGEDATASLVHLERMRERIEAKVREMGLGEHVKLMGGVGQEELVRLFRRADVFVMPGLDIPGDVEGFGIVILEAALAGVPTVATRVGGVPEAVEEGKTGLLVEAGNWEGMAGAVGKLLSDEGLRRKLGEAAAERARERFSWEVIVGEYEGMLGRCVR